MMLLSTTIPFSTVFADYAEGEVDDLIVTIRPRFGTAMGEEVAVSAQQNLFTFDFELRHADGSAYLVSQYRVEFHTVDGKIDPAAPTTLVWGADYTVDPTSRGVIRVPASALAYIVPAEPGGYDHEMPFSAISMKLLAQVDGAGNPLADPSGNVPAGYYSLAANAAVDAGDFANADQLDEVGTPLLLFNGQLSGLVQFGNPVLNPGFEVGADDQQFDTSACSCPLGAQFTSGIPPWILLTDGYGVPASNHYIKGAAGSSGSAAEVRYSPADNGKGVHFGQLFFVPGAGQTVDAQTETPAGAWYGTNRVKVEFDVKVSDPTNSISSYLAATTLHWNDSSVATGERQLTKWPSSAIPANDGLWHHVVLDFGNVANGKQLNSLFFSFNLVAPTGSDLTVDFDNVRVLGAVLRDDVNPTTDMTDGYSTFVFPVGDDVQEESPVVIQDLTTLTNGNKVYAFRLSAVNYAGIDPASVDLNAQAYSVFQLLNESYVKTMVDGGDTGTTNASTTPWYASTIGVNSASFYQFLNTDGTPSTDLLVVIPAEDAAKLAGARVVPHLFVDVATDDIYTTAFGQTTEPAHGFYSWARNNMMFTHLADTMDYHFTPIRLSGETGASVVRATNIEISCPIMSSTVMCASDPEPDLTVKVQMESLVVETLVVDLYHPGTETVLASTTVTTPGGEVVLTINESQMSAMYNESDLSVVARVHSGVFADGAETEAFRLDNLAPVAKIVAPDLTNVIKGSRVTFTSGSTDADGVIEQHLWLVNVLGDSTPDADNITLGIYASSSDSDISFVIPDDGDFEVTLKVIDDGSASNETVTTFSIANRAPTVVIDGPAFAKIGEPLVYTYSIFDSDGIAAETHEVDADGDGVFESTRIAPAPIATSFATNGTHRVSVSATDDDGATQIQHFDIVIESEGPVSELAIPEAPLETNGWFMESVDIEVARADVGDVQSGVASSTIVIGDAVETVVGDANFTRTISGDGVHAITVFSTDRSGNIGANVTGVVQIDASRPSVAITGPIVLDGSPIAYVARSDEPVNVTVDAVDDHSGIVKVEFFVDGGDAAGVDTTADDGWYFVWQAAGTGFHEVAVIATNAAGLRELSETITILVI